MRTGTFRRIDRWVGGPVCAVLSALRRVAGVFLRPRLPPPEAIRRVLFVKLAEQGATVQAWPALRRAVDRVGAENVYFLVFEENRFILDVLGVIPPENVIAIRTGGLLRLAASLAGAIWRMRGLELDAAIDFEFFARGSAILAALSGAPVRVGFNARASGGPWRGRLLTHRLCYNPHLHVRHLYDTMVRALDCDPARLPALPMDLAPDLPAPPRFQPTPEQRDRVRGIIEEATGTADFSPLVLLNANASDLLPLRRWPTERYVELARRLLAASGRLRIGFTGAPDEAPAIERLVAEVDDPRCVSLAGKTTLQDLLVVYTLADVLVTNDSGPGQFAQLTDIRSVILFGPETPRIFGPESDRAHVLWKGIPCSPCVSAYNNRDSICPDNVCMQRLGPGEVFDVVRGLLGL